MLEWNYVHSAFATVILMPCCTNAMLKKTKRSTASSKDRELLNQHILQLLSYKVYEVEAQFMKPSSCSPKGD